MNGDRAAPFGSVPVPKQRPWHGLLPSCSVACMALETACKVEEHEQELPVPYKVSTTRYCLHSSIGHAPEGQPTTLGARHDQVPGQRSHSSNVSDPGPAARHALVAARFTAVVAGTNNWAAPTPIREWSSLDIVSHLLEWLPPMMGAWADVHLPAHCAADPVLAWHTRAVQVQRILEDPHLAVHPVKVGPFEGLPLALVIDHEYTDDVYMHTWDLAKSTGSRPGLAPELAEDIHERLHFHDGEARRRAGHYGPAQPTTSTDPVDQLMAYVGRDVDGWRSPTWASTTANGETHRI